MPPDWQVNRRRALTSGNVAARTRNLVAEQRALTLCVGLCAMASV